MSTTDWSESSSFLFFSFLKYALKLTEKLETMSSTKAQRPYAKNWPSSHTLYLRSAMVAIFLMFAKASTALPSFRSCRHPIPVINAERRRKKKATSVIQVAKRNNYVMGEPKEKLATNLSRRCLLQTRLWRVDRKLYRSRRLLLSRAPRKAKAATKRTCRRH